MIDKGWAGVILQGAEMDYDKARSNAAMAVELTDAIDTNAAYIVSSEERNAWCAVIGLFRELGEDEATITPEDIIVALEAHREASRRAEAIFDKAINAYKLAVI